MTETTEGVKYISPLLKLSASYFPRVQLGLAKADEAPLPAKRWHEIRSTKDACKNVVAGVIVHGGPLRAVNVCATKGCPKHFPISKKSKQPTAAMAPVRDTWAEQEAQRKRDDEVWKQLLSSAAPALASHLAKVKFNADLVRAVVAPYDLQNIVEKFGVKLTDKTAAQVLALSTVQTYTRAQFLRSVKPMKFNLGTIEQRLKADAKKAAAKAGKTAKKAGA